MFATKPSMATVKNKDKQVIPHDGREGFNQRVQGARNMSPDAIDPISDSSLRPAFVVAQERIRASILFVVQSMVAGRYRDALAKVDEFVNEFNSDRSVMVLGQLVERLVRLDFEYHGCCKAPTAAAVIHGYDAHKCSGDTSSWLDVGIVPFKHFVTQCHESTDFSLGQGAQALAYVEVILEFSKILHAEIISRVDSYVAILPALRRLQRLRRESLERAELHSTFALAFGRLVLEIDLLESLWTVEYKLSVLSGADALAALLQAERMLKSYTEYRGGVQSLNMAHGSLASLSCFKAGSEGSTSSISSRAPGTTANLQPRTSTDGIPLHLWYHWFYNHCKGRLRLLCGAGLCAALRLGPSQIIDQRGAAKGLYSQSQVASAPEAACAEASLLCVPCTDHPHRS